MKLSGANKVFRERARELRKNGTLSEALLWKQLKNKQLFGLDFDRQRVINNKYIVDFFCPDCCLVIEIDGYSHEDKHEYDAERHDYLLKLGLNVLHIGDLDVKTNMDGVLELIRQSVISCTSLVQTK